MLFFIYFFLFYLISCSDNDINENIFNHTINNKEAKRKLENDDYEEINILFNKYDVEKQCKAYSDLPGYGPVMKEIEVLLNFLETFPNILKKLIKSKKINKKQINIKADALQKLQDNNFAVEDGLLDKTFDNDLVIFIGINTLDEKYDEVDIIQYDDIDENRPTVGFIKYNYHFIKKIKENQKNQILNILFLHGVTHILGFKKTILRNKNLSVTIDNIGRVKQYKKDVIKNEKILAIARKYYNCSNIDYIELDENSAGNNELIHWEGRGLYDF